MFHMLTAVFYFPLELLHVEYLGLKMLRSLVRNVPVAAWGSFKTILLVGPPCVAG